MNHDHKMDSAVSVQIINAFVSGSPGAFTGGNPAGVVFDADDLTDAHMLSIAAQVGLSETAFVSKSDISDFKLDFFTPKKRIAHCGHATIATFAYLAKSGHVSEGATSKETIDGPRAIQIRNGAAYMEQLVPTLEQSTEWQDQTVTEYDVLAALGMSAEDRDPKFPLVRAFNGNGALLIPVASQDVLKSVRADLDVIEKISEALDLIGFYVFTTNTTGSNADATTRMFGPRYGIKEEAATGMMAGPLGYLLHLHDDQPKRKYTIAQGFFMTPSSPSVLNVELEGTGETIESVMAGGFGDVQSELQITP